MGKLVIKRRPSKVPQIGDMRTRISIFQREMLPPVFESTSFTQSLTLIATVWSQVETVGGTVIFDDTNLKSGTTHKFTIRFRSDVNTANIIQFDGDSYKILEADNSNLRKRFLFLFCALLGDETFEENR